MILKIKKLQKDAQIPSYQSEEASGFDCIQLRILF